METAIPHLHQPLLTKYAIHVTDQRYSARKRRKLDKDHECEEGPSWAAASTRFPQDDNTVGWICALPLERAAAEAMLDEIHPLPAQLSQRSKHQYTETG
jgi:hypothetical protein